MNKPARTALIATVTILIFVSGCWDSRQQLKEILFPIMDLAIDPSACQCSSGGVIHACPKNENDPLPDQATCNALYMATDGGGILKTSDGGATWRNLLVPSELYIKALIVDPHPTGSTPRTVYAGTEDGGVFRSFDGGDNWIPQSETIPISSVSEVVIDRNSCLTGGLRCRELYAASRADGVFKSDDHGISWKKMTTNGLNETTVSSLALSPKGIFPTKIYAGTEGGHVFRYQPDLSNPQDPTLGAWTEGGTQADPLPEEVITLAVQPTADQIIYAGLGGGEQGIGGGGVYRSIDAGGSWKEVPIPTGQAGSDSVFVISFVLSPNPFTGPELGIYAGVFGLSLCQTVSCESSNDWITIDVGRDKGVSALAIDPYTHQTLYVGTFKGELFKSVDGGLTWSQITIGP